ncbi:hypothetical protein [Pseudokineococcus lusitanus]|uniref:Lipoprotein n=1 Tax=Pseudokineococcus lusitanus TaxID=763993 RepID=A0A3N1HQ73_9ACTN|nr:hypothetical protein [Pseudokineococcus lusitanus]ROP44635.1 hypothetical protein EDC03_0761 [Pseudokineococcus lusitanus]
MPAAPAAPTASSTAAARTAPRRGGAPVRRTVALAVAATLGLAGCTGGDGGAAPGAGAGGAASPTAEAPLVRPAAVDGGVVLDVAEGGDRSVAASAALVAASPLVVLVDAGADVGAAAARAEELGVPLLVVAAAPAPSSGAEPSDEPSDEPSADAAEPSADAGAEAPAGAAPEDVVAEVARLGAEQVLAADDAAASWAEEALDVEVLPAAADVEAPAPAAAGAPVLLLTDGSAGDVAPAATARAAGARVVAVPGGDPRADGDVVEQVAAAAPDGVVATSPLFGDAEQVRARTAVAATGVQLPGGGQVPFPGRHMVALYGTPGSPSLGVLGEQGLEASVERARDVAAEYEDLVGDPVVPTFEIITTVASGAPGPDGDYSNELDADDLRPWVDAAGEAGIYVVLDLQPGRTDFLTQARAYESLLAEPHVGLALDPEWRLEPDQVHLEQVGRVDVEEVEETADWLADLVRRETLPPKVFLLHQFQQRMITDRGRLDTSRDELVPLVHADGHGTPGQKADTYRALQQDAPEGMRWGWKNFYDEDTPTMTPAETMAEDPLPDFVSYQ